MHCHSLFSPQISTSFPANSMASLFSTSLAMAGGILYSNPFTPGRQSQTPPNFYSSPCFAPTFIPQISTSFAANSIASLFSASFAIARKILHFQCFYTRSPIANATRFYSPHSRESSPDSPTPDACAFNSTSVNVLVLTHIHTSQKSSVEYRYKYIVISVHNPLFRKTSPTDLLAQLTEVTPAKHALREDASLKRLVTKSSKF
jgi:hypothetical protein